MLPSGRHDRRHHHLPRHLLEPGTGVRDLRPAGEPGGLLGFVEIEELIFGERTKLLIDSSEERLKTEFEGVKRTYLPMHAVIRIDEVEKAGRGRITSGDGKVASFPVTIVQPARGPVGES